MAVGFIRTFHKHNLDAFTGTDKGDEDTRDAKATWNVGMDKAAYGRYQYEVPADHTSTSGTYRATPVAGQNGVPNPATAKDGTAIDGQPVEVDGKHYCHSTTKLGLLMQLGVGSDLAKAAFPLQEFSNQSNAETRMEISTTVHNWSNCASHNITMPNVTTYQVEMTFDDADAQTTWINAVNTAQGDGTTMWKDDSVYYIDTNF